MKGFFAAIKPCNPLAFILRFAVVFEILSPRVEIICQGG
jgi:hypothetical protein